MKKKKEDEDNHDIRNLLKIKSKGRGGRQTPRKKIRCVAWNQLVKLSEEGSRLTTTQSYKPMRLWPHICYKKVFSTSWRQPKLLSYNGKIDHEDHLHYFITNMEDVIDKDDIWYRMFRRTLREEAIGWYLRLLKGSIKCFLDLKSALHHAYNHQARRKGRNATLLNIKQEPMSH